MNRVGTTKQAAQHFGFTRDDGLPNVRAFMAWTREKKIKPEHGQKHHLWWNFKTIEQCLDKNNESKPKSSNWRENFKLRMAQLAGNQSEIPTH